MENREDGAPDCAGRNGAQPKKRVERTRHNELIGGGYFVFRRGTRTGRIKTGSIMAGRVPFEHPSYESAMAEACRLQAIHGGQYDVFEAACAVGHRGAKPIARATVQS